MKEILIDISPTGDVTIEGKGFAGPECKLFTKELEDALGDVTKTELKPEYRRNATVTRKAGA